MIRVLLKEAVGFASPCSYRRRESLIGTPKGRSDFGDHSLPASSGSAGPSRSASATNLSNLGYERFSLRIRSHSWSPACSWRKRAKSTTSRAFASGKPSTISINSREIVLMGKDYYPSPAPASVTFLPLCCVAKEGLPTKTHPASKASSGAGLAVGGSRESGSAGFSIRREIQEALAIQAIKLRWRNQTRAPIGEPNRVCRVPAVKIPKSWLRDIVIDGVTDDDDLLLRGATEVVRSYPIAGPCGPMTLGNVKKIRLIVGVQPGQINL